VIYNVIQDMLSGRQPARGGLLRLAKQQDQGRQRTKVLPATIDLPTAAQGVLLEETVHKHARELWRGADRELFERVSDNIWKQLEEPLQRQSGKISVAYRCYFGLFVPENYGLLFDLLCPGAQRSKREHDFTFCPKCAPILRSNSDLSIRVGGKSGGQYSYFCMVRRDFSILSVVVVVTYEHRYLSNIVNVNEKVHVDHPPPAEVSRLVRSQLPTCDECALPAQELIEAALTLMTLGMQKHSWNNVSFAQWIQQYFANTKKEWQQVVKKHGMFLPFQDALAYDILRTWRRDKAVTIDANNFPKHLQSLLYISSLYNKQCRPRHDVVPVNRTVLNGSAYLAPAYLYLDTRLYNPGMIPLPLVIKLSKEPLDLLKSSNIDSPSSPVLSEGKAKYTIYKYLHAFNSFNEQIEAVSAPNKIASEHSDLEAKVLSSFYRQAKKLKEDLLARPDIRTSVKHFLLQPIQWPKHTGEHESKVSLIEGIFPIMLQGPGYYKALFLPPTPGPSLYYDIATISGGADGWANWLCKQPFVVLLMLMPNAEPRLTAYSPRKGAWRMGDDIESFFYLLGFIDAEVSRDGIHELDPYFVNERWKTLWRRGVPLSKIDKTNKAWLYRWHKKIIESAMAIHS